jgi:hypothetical protein
MHGILQGKLVGFIFTPKRFVELSVMRWNTAGLVFGILRVTVYCGIQPPLLSR